MSDKVFLNATRTAVVDQFGPGKKWQVSREEAVRLGLLDKDDPAAKPQARRAAAFDASKASLPVEKKAPRKTSRKRK